jgi:MYXO-CTERM domain-containing protein
VTDVRAGNGGSVADAMLEIDFDGTVAPPVNTPPVANAGKDQTVNGGVGVTLDGSQSLDPDGDTLSFSWTQPTGEQVALGGAATATATFVAPRSADTKTLVFRLSVDDGRGGSSTDDVTITVIGDDPGKPNQAPIVVTNGDQTVMQGTTVVLDASASTDPEGDPLSFRWQQVSGVEVPLAGANTAVAELAAPNVSDALELRFRVEVEDGRGGISLDDVAIRVIAQDPGDPNDPDPALTRGEEIGGGCGCTASETGSGIPLLLLGLLWFLRRR